MYHVLNKSVTRYFVDFFQLPQDTNFQGPLISWKIHSSSSKITKIYLLTTNKNSKLCIQVINKENFTIFKSSLFQGFYSFFFMTRTTFENSFRKIRRYFEGVWRIGMTEDKIEDVLQTLIKQFQIRFLKIQY